MRELDRRNQAVLSGLSDSILCWDAQNEAVLFCNQVFARAVGAAPDQIIGRPLAQVSGPQLYATARLAMAELKSKPAAQHVVKHASADGGSSWRNVHYTRIEDEAGVLRAYLACGRDLTEQYRYTGALEELSALDFAADADFGKSLADVLDIGRRFLDAPHGALFEIDGEGHRVVASVGPPEPGLAPGAAIFLPHDLCARDCGPGGAAQCRFRAAPGPVLPGFAADLSARPTPGADPQSCKFVADEAAPAGEGPARLHRYGGAQVHVGGEVYGVIGFFAEADAGREPFSEFHRAFIRHLARWIGLKIEAHRQRQALRQSEAELRLIFDNVPQTLWRLDAAHAVRAANASAARALAAEGGMDVDAFMQRLDPRWGEHSRAVLGAGRAIRGVVAQNPGADGAPQWTSTDIIPHHAAAPDGSSLLVVSSDISAAKARENELEALNAALDINQKRFELLYRRTPALMCSFLADGALVEVSDLWLETTGFARADVIGRPVGDFLDESSRQRFAEKIWPALWREGACHAAPLDFVVRSGGVLETEFSAFVNARDASAPSCLAVLVDVTARNNAERALEQANRDLANANDGLKKFAHIASHDLQEPLRKIKQFSDLLVTEYRDKLDEDGAYFLKVMRDSTDRMRQLVRDILTFSKTVNGALQKTELAIPDMLRVLLAEFDVAMREAEAEVEIGEILPIRGDPTAVELMFRNLLSNALKYRRPEAPARISARGAWTDYGLYAITVADNGCGVDSRYATHIFEPFTRLQTQTQTPGSGIGLAICKSVCDRHHWTITVESVLGSGSQFTVHIPAADVGAEPALASHA